MILWTHDRWRFPLPANNRFPIEKYTLLRERVEGDGVDVREAEPVPWEWLAAVHDRELLERIRTGALSVREQRGLGIPWSAQLVERGRRSVGGTVEAARLAVERGIGMNLGGGTHHAGRAFARGYCLFNDVAVALERLRAETGLRRALVVDCDVHQGDGTADLLGADPECFTLSLHGARNYPWKSVSSSVLASSEKSVSSSVLATSDVGRRYTSDLDVDLPSGTGDDAYLSALTGALDRAIPAARAELAFYLAGADPWHGDRLGRLALTKAGLLARDELVLDRLLATGAAVCVVLAGGYAEDVRDTVDINAATVGAVTRRSVERSEMPMNRG